MPRLAVLGHPVSHSRSPAMQNAALARLGLANWNYEAIDVPTEDFRELVSGLAGRGFAGVNVTVPHKELALAVSDRRSEAAGQIGAANTLTFTSAGIEADNTDAPGLIDALTEARGLPGEGTVAADRPGLGQSALVLGAGGAARAVVWALAGEKMQVAVWNRTSARAASLAGEFGAEAIEGQIDPAGFDVIVNASAAGLGGEDALAELPLQPSGFRPGQIVADMVYGAGPGALVEAARKAGAHTVDGLEILVRQGARSLKIWTGQEPDLDVMRKAARS
ncbi:MAG: shikimate dehydrogenase [Solirubrobacterales bacterium]|nr:shikimate dehydrogenase [Solirubrobacterales bacterium]